MSAVPPAQVAAWAALADAATAGPWHTDGEDGYPVGGYLLIRFAWQRTHADIYALGQRDAAFIAAARTAVPALCAEVRRLQTQLAECEAHCSDLIADAARFRAERDALRAGGADHD